MSEQSGDKRAALVWWECATWFPRVYTPVERTTRERWRRIIFDHDTAAGRAFDVALIIAILGSVVVMMLDSLPKLSVETHALLR